MLSLKRKIAWLTLFSIAMGFMETAVVIYLRKLYYPGGFTFPLIPVSPDIAVVEFLREAATIIMLVGVGVFSGKTTSQKFAFFIYCFAIWDLFYYVFLKIFLGWPVSLCTWDILFLIPFPWVGPVLVPCLVSTTMIMLALLVVYGVEKYGQAKIKIREWILFSIGSLVIITSFVTPYLSYLKQEGTTIWTINSGADLFEEVRKYVPEEYNWPLFGLGEALLLFGIFLFTKDLSKIKKYDTTIKSSQTL